MHGVLFLVAAAPILGFSWQASATPYIHVSAFYQLLVPDPLPAGIAETCVGDGCDGAVDVIHDFTSNITETASLAGGAVFTNMAGTPSDAFYVVINYSEFNPGGPEIGLSIDNAAQTASFSSGITVPFGGGDMVSCSVPSKAGDRGYLSTLTCGVRTPDFNGQEFPISSLPPGGSVELDWSILITDSFSVVPEPSGLAVLGSTLLGLGLLRNRRCRGNRRLR